LDLPHLIGSCKGIGLTRQPRYKISIIKPRS
jgi:hypothetical protein